MPGSESLQIRSYLLARRAAAASSAPVPLAQQRASYEVLVENYVVHPVPLPEGTRVEFVDNVQDDNKKNPLRDKKKESQHAQSSQI